MRIWACANQKGGVGKTTTTVTLAGHLAAQGRRTLLVDLDPHGSLTAYFGLDPDTLEDSLYRLFDGEQAWAGAGKLVRETGHENLHLLPASTALATIERQLGVQEGKGLVISHALQALAGEFEYALIDCPPVLGILMVNALAACEHLLLPVQTEPLALKGLERMMRTLEMIVQARKQSLAYTIVPTMFDRRTRAAIESLRQLRERYGEQVWDSVVPVDTQFRDASRRGAPLSIDQPRARGSRAYAALLDTLCAAGTPRRAEIAS